MRPTLRGLRLRRRLFWEILRVGAPGSLNTILTNLTVVLLTALVGPFGATALAGYGLGARLEYLQIPIVFGLGSGLVTMVGTSVGAGHRARAQRVAWIGAAMAAGITGTIGILAALFPHAWLGLFTSDPQVLAAGTRYLAHRRALLRLLRRRPRALLRVAGSGPSAAGRCSPAPPGWRSRRRAAVIATRWLGAGLPGMFAAMAGALVAIGLINVAAIRLGAWRGVGRRGA